MDTPSSTNKQNKTVAEFLGDISTRFDKHEALLGRRGSVWYALTYQDLKAKASAASLALSALGIKRGDKVAVMAQSQPEFAVAFFAIALSGAVTVPIDVKLSLDDQAYMIGFSDAKAIICLDELTLKTALSLSEKIPSLQKSVYMIDYLCDYIQEHSSTLQLVPEALRNDELAVIAFTSGTVSLPKGVMLTWSNLLFQALACNHTFPDAGSRRMLSVLPLHHMFEFSAGLLNPLSTGAMVYYANSMMPQQILSFIRDKKITSMIVVPLFLRALKKGLETELKSRLLIRAWFVGTQLLATLIPIMSVRRRLFQPIHAKLGGALVEFVVGGSRMDISVAEFFENIGIGVYEGYGLTETSPIVSTNCAAATRRGTVGKPLNEIEVRLEPGTSNVLVKGPNVMLGYYKNPVSTAECLSPDGWFNTGDIGAIDRKGFLSIVGRTKDIIVLGNGKKVVPDEVEGFFKDIDFIQDICVVGITARNGVNKGTEVVHAVVVLNPQYLNDPQLSREQQVEHYMTILGSKAQHLSYYKRPLYFIIQEQPLPKTSTLKTKRFLVKELLMKQKETT
jgi:long-chain acyl-CoA synthetase